MLDKIKELGAQVATKANDAMEGITTSVKGGVDSLANTATSMTEALNEKAVGWHALTALGKGVGDVGLVGLSRGWLFVTPFEDSGRATRSLHIACPIVPSRSPAASGAASAPRAGATGFDHSGVGERDIAAQLGWTDVQPLAVDQ